jgi:hypothetical protein
MATVVDCLRGVSMGAPSKDAFKAKLRQVAKAPREPAKPDADER